MTTLLAPLFRKLSDEQLKNMRRNAAHKGKAAYVQAIQEELRRRDVERRRAAMHIVR